MTSRRSFLAALAAGTAGAWFAAHASELEAAGKLAAAADAGEKYLVLTAEQAAFLDAGDTPYAALDPLDQHAILVQFERSNPDAFGGFRALTMMGMFSNPSYGGNYQKSGWKMIGFEDRFAWSPPFGYYDRG